MKSQPSWAVPRWELHRTALDWHFNSQRAVKTGYTPGLYKALHLLLPFNAPGECGGLQ